MPCDTIQTNTVDLSASDHGLLRLALEALGYDVQSHLNGASLLFYRRGSYVGVHEAGKLEVVQGADIDAIKRAYSTQVLKAGAARFGWRLQQKDDTRFAIARRA